MPRFCSSSLSQQSQEKSTYGKQKAIIDNHIRQETRQNHTTRCLCAASPLRKEDLVGLLNTLTEMQAQQRRLRI